MNKLKMAVIKYVKERYREPEGMDLPGAKIDYPMTMDIHAHHIGRRITLVLVLWT